MNRIIIYRDSIAPVEIKTDSTFKVMDKFAPAGFSTMLEIRAIKRKKKRVIYYAMPVVESKKKHAC